MSGILDLRHIHWCIPNADFVAKSFEGRLAERSIGMNERDEAMSYLDVLLGFQIEER
jgi:hypothetical protein